MSVFKELLSAAQGLGHALESAQGLNPELLSQNDMLYLLLPLWFQDKMLSGELLLQLPEREADAAQNRDVNLVFLLNMSELGPVCIEARLGPGQLSGHILVDYEAKAVFMRNRLDELESGLKKAGFKSDFTVRVASAPHDLQASPLAELIRDSGRSISITV